MYPLSFSFFSSLWYNVYIYIYNYIYSYTRWTRVTSLCNNRFNLYGFVLILYVLYKDSRFSIITTYALLIYIYIYVLRNICNIHTYILSTYICTRNTFRRIINYVQVAPFIILSLPTAAVVLIPYGLTSNRIRRFILLQYHLFNFRGKYNSSSCRLYYWWTLRKTYIYNERLKYQKFGTITHKM